MTINTLKSNTARTIALPRFALFLITALLLFTGLTGCETPVEPLADGNTVAHESFDDFDASDLSAGKKKGPRKLITGSGVVLFLGEEIHSKAIVLQGNDGSRKGEYKAFIPYLGTTHEIETSVDCAAIVKNADGSKEAWFAGRITKTNCDLGSGCPIEYPLGHAFGLRWRDNGQGAKASPDQGSFLYQIPSGAFPQLVEPQDWCDAKPDVALFFEFEEGGIKIKMPK